MEYYLSRAKVLGMTYLQRCKQLGLDTDLAAAERYQNACTKNCKSSQVPLPPAIERETLPDVST